MKKIKMAKGACVVGEKLPLFGPTYYCPNAECSFEKPLKQGAKCPQCGAEAKPFGMREGAALFATKKTSKKAAAGTAGNAGNVSKGGYFCPNPGCANVTELRQGEKCPACGTEAQSDESQGVQQQAEPGEGRDGGIPLFTDATTDGELQEKIRLGVERLNGLGQPAQGGSGGSAGQMPGVGLKAVYEQNRVIIMQNELILRHLKKNGK